MGCASDDREILEGVKAWMLKTYPTPPTYEIAALDRAISALDRPSAKAARRWPVDAEILDVLSVSQPKPTWMVLQALARPRPPQAWLLGRLAALYTAGLVQLEWIGHGRCWSRVR